MRVLLQADEKEEGEVWKRGLRGLGSGEGCREDVEEKHGDGERAANIGSGVSRMEEEQLSGGVWVWIAQVGGTTSMEGV